MKIITYGRYYSFYPPMTFLHTPINFSIAKTETELKSFSPVIRSLCNVWGVTAWLPASIYHLNFLQEGGFLLRSLNETFHKDEVNIQNFISESSRYRSHLVTVLQSSCNSHLLHILSHCFNEKLKKQGIRQDSLLPCRNSTFMYRDENSIWNTHNTIADMNLC